MGLPIRRPAGKLTGSVLATKAELDAWLEASPIRKSFSLLPRHRDTALLLTEFRRQVKEMRRLHENHEELRDSVEAGLQLLKKNLQLTLPKAPESEPAPPTDSDNHMLADVLSFDPPKKKLH